MNSSETVTPTQQPVQMTEKPAGENQQKPRAPRQPKEKVVGENVDQAVTDEQKANNRNRNKNRNRNNKRGGAGEGQSNTQLEETKDETRPQTAPQKNNNNNKNYNNNNNQAADQINNQNRNRNRNTNQNKQNPKGGNLNQQQNPQYREQYQRKGGDARGQKVRVSTEEGFTGPPSEWFDDKEFSRLQGIELSKKDHDYYYGSYSSFHIHEEMLKDTTRTRTYQRAIEENPEDFKDKIVLDIGCGTGILSIFAARAGAKHVYAIENAEIALYAEEIIKQNGLSDKITVIKGKMEEIKLPVDTVDIIISEWMGYFLLYESMLDSVLWARDQYLNKQTGKILPDKACVYIAALEDGEYKGQKREFWNDVYGVNMSCMAPTVMREPLVDVVHSEMVMSNSCKVLQLDLVKMKKEEVNFSSEFNLTFNFKDKVHAVVAYWDTEFSNLTRPVTLSTSPFKKSTHWKQTVFYLEHDLPVKAGDNLKGTVAVRQSKVNFRELDIKFSFHINTDLVKRDFTNMFKLR